MKEENNPRVSWFDEVKPDHVVIERAKDHAAYGWSMTYPEWYPEEKKELYRKTYLEYRAELKAKGQL